MKEYISPSSQQANQIKSKMSTATATQQNEQVVYEMFIPFLYRGKDKDSTERRVFWVFKQLNWGYISQVQVFGFEDDTKKNVTARISYTRINPKTQELIEQLDAGETAQVHYEQGKPWFWNVVKYTRRAPAAVEPQVTFKIKVKPTGTVVKTAKPTTTVTSATDKTTVTSDKTTVTSATEKPRPHTPPMEPPTEFKPTVKPTGTVVKPSSNKFKVLDVDGISSSSDSEEPK